MCRLDNDFVLHLLGLRPSWGLQDATALQLREEVQHVVPRDCVLLIDLNLDVLVNLEGIVEDLRRGHHYLAARLVKGARADLLLQHVRRVPQDLELDHLLAIPEPDFAGDRDGDELALAVVELEQLDLSGMCVYLSVVILGGLVHEVDRAGHASERKDIQLL